MSDTAIHISGLKKRYKETVALASVSLDIARAEMFGLIGPDGAGKTTLIRILSSLMDPDAGECRILDIPVMQEPAKIREIVGYMPQRFSLYQDLTVQENLRFFADLFQVPKKERIRRAAELLEFSRLAPFVNRRAGQLSGGMKQKLALSCALIHTPEILILDEPTTGVDPVSRREFWEILGELKGRGVTILVSTPYMDEAEKCDRVALMHKGNILAVGTAGDITKRFPGTVYAVRGPDLTGLAGWFKKMLSPEQVRILGDRIHVSLFEDARKTMDGLRRSAGENGWRIDSADITPAGLEDTFVALIEGERGGMPHPVDPVRKVSENNSGAFPEYAVQVTGLTRRFGDFVAVDGISFEVKRGEIFGFLGANGAGKTTTIRMLTGLLKPTSGEGTVGGWDINRDYEKIKTRIGYMSQRFSLYDDLKTEENLFFFGGIYGLSRARIAERVGELDAALSLSEIKGRKTGSLPLGFKQRLALACAILHNPPILFLDEPTGGVDPIARRYFWDLISALAAGGTTVFVTTHYMDEAEYCHRLSIMYKGRIVDIESPTGIKKKYNMTSIQDVFIHLVDR